MRHTIDVKETEDVAGRHHGGDRVIDSCGAEGPFRTVKMRGGNGGHRPITGGESGKRVRTQFAGVPYRIRFRPNAKKDRQEHSTVKDAKKDGFPNGRREGGRGGVKEGAGNAGREARKKTLGLNNGRARGTIL